VRYLRAPDLPGASWRYGARGLFGRSGLVDAEVPRPSGRDDRGWTVKRGRCTKVDRSGGTGPLEEVRERIGGPGWSLTVGRRDAITIPVTATKPVEGSFSVPFGYVDPNHHAILELAE